MRGKCQGFVLYRQTWQCNENITDCGGKRAVVLPTGCPRSAGLLAGICRTKVKVPAIPREWGGPWLQMTSALRLQMADLKDDRSSYRTAEEEGCSTARLPKGKMNTYSNLKMSEFE